MASSKQSRVGPLRMDAKDKRPTPPVRPPNELEAVLAFGLEKQAGGVVLAVQLDGGVVLHLLWSPSLAYQAGNRLAIAAAQEQAERQATTDDPAAATDAATGDVVASEATSPEEQARRDRARQRIEAERAKALEGRRPPARKW
jgi:hypothetical protein